jgi:FemAB-related protein (PEP-CTERM system-associated)
MSPAAERSGAPGVPGAGAPAVQARTAPAPELELRRSNPADDAERDAFVLAHPRGTFFHTAGWRRVVEQAMGHAPRDLVALRDGEIAGVLPLMRSPALWGPPAWISMPYAVYGGPLGDAPGVERALVAEGLGRAAAEGAGRLELRSLEETEPVDHPRMARSELYATFIAELPAERADVLASMPKKARAEARKARERFGLRLNEGVWYLEDFYWLFQENKRSLGSPGLPAALFKALCGEFGSRVRVHLVQKGSQPLAGVMSFEWRDTLLAYYAGTARGADRDFSASNFMYMALREWAVERGFKRFDFGRSRKDSGAFRFKEHQGFTPRDLEYRFYLLRDRRPPSFTPSNPRTRVLRETWSRLPLGVTRRLSDVVARYLP